MRAVIFISAAASAAGASPGYEIYQSLAQFQLSDKSVIAEQLQIKRDRVEMSFNGTFYLEAPVAGKIRGAVFIGIGKVHIEPPVEFERDNLRRMLHADAIDSDFRTVVLRFTDDTAQNIAARPRNGSPPEEARKLAQEFGARLLKETGVNAAARLAVSILNQEEPGFFLAQFDKGRRSRFTFVLDAQGRVPSSVFGVNAGEKGLVFAHHEPLGGNDIWMAFYSLDDYQKGTVQYTDVFDVASIQAYTMNIDVRDANKKALRTEVRMDGQARGRLQALPLDLNEGLPEFESIRLKKALRIRSARSVGGPNVEAAQEDWETGLTVYFAEPLSSGNKFSVQMDLEGDFMLTSPDIERIGYHRDTLVQDVYYPRVTTSWYPKLGFLARSTFDLTFHHKNSHRVASIGRRVSEDKVPGGSESVTRWKMDQPVSFCTFGVGNFEIQTGRAIPDIPIEYFSLGGFRLTGSTKQSYMMTELTNTLQYFSALFGEYPYINLQAMFHPRPFGQGFPTFLLLAPLLQQINEHEFAFIAHEMSHQWWGNAVAWRSYRDQWLSEGFADYSGALYVEKRMDPGARADLIREMRRVLKEPPVTERGIGKGTVADLGPLILGLRLSSAETRNAYWALIYKKGALVLRMLHFLLSDPSTGDDAAFYEMLKDFVRRYQQRAASTENFRDVASEHFSRSPIAAKYGLKDLNWFFRQWVYQAYLPSYRLEYQIQDLPGGGVAVKGTVFQDKAGEKWFMPLPVVFRFGKDKFARGTVHALGESAPFATKLPARPSQVQFDPDQWVLSESTTAAALKD
jgi:hypothetical protein